MEKSENLGVETIKIHQAFHHQAPTVKQILQLIINTTDDIKQVNIIKIDQKFKNKIDRKIRSQIVGLSCDRESFNSYIL